MNNYTQEGVEDSRYSARLLMKSLWLIVATFTHSSIVGLMTGDRGSVKQTIASGGETRIGSAEKACGAENGLLRTGKLYKEAKMREWQSQAHVNIIANITWCLFPSIFGNLSTER